MTERRLERRRFGRLAGSAPLLSPDQEVRLFRLAREGDRQATRLIVQSHMRLVVNIAMRYERGGLSVEDLVSEGVVGLLEALQRFDLSRGVRFAGYAAWWIRARVSQYAFANRRSVGVPSTRNGRCVMRELGNAERQLTQKLLRAPSHEELAQEIGVSVEDIEQVRAALQNPDLTIDQQQAVSDAESPEQLVERKEHEVAQKMRVQRALGVLSAREQAIVSEQYLVEEGRSLAQLGRAFGVSRQRLGQVLSNAREKLKAELTQVA